MRIFLGLSDRRTQEHGAQEAHGFRTTCRSCHQKAGAAQRSLVASYTGSTMCDGCFADRCTVFFATRVSLSARNARPVFGFASKRGELDEESAMRMRCPVLNTSDVLHRSTFSSYTRPGTRSDSFSKDL